MRDNFESAMNNLKEWEGFLSNDSSDPGGLTKYGIAKTYYPNIDIENLTWEEAKAIYLRDYWIKNGCDNLLFPLDVVHFDSCVNPGPGASKKFLADSSEHKDVDRRCIEYLTLRQRYYLKKVQETPAKIKFICGWMDRTLDMIERAIITKWDQEYL